MTQAGWYPDPAGQPQTYRYWDGTSWSQDTTGDPYAPPPAPAAPPPAAPPPPAWSSSQEPPTVVTGGNAPPPPSYGQVPAPGYGAVTPPPAGGYGQQPPPGGGFPPAPPSGGSRGSGLRILLVVVAVLALIGLSVGGFFGYRALAGDDDNDSDAGDATSATDTATDPSTPTESTSSTDSTDSTEPTETTTTGGTTVTDQQCRGGRPTPSVPPGDDAEQVSGGALTIPVPPGYTADTTYSTAFTWADDFTPLQKVIEEGENQGWVAVYGVGALRKANGFDDPAQAAEVVMTCMAQSTDLYSHFTGREDLSSGTITIDGNDAYQITSELRVDDPELAVEGDVAQVIVVDMGDPDRFGLYITVVPIGDQKLIRQQEAMVGRITVD
ncbi:DUF2510 domain-containing protein [Nocardioides sp. HM23]|uniref:DUF2510 domain-containing protein n=1 Tax=Nocardioides bizhenqiangii TaxID=3095076 RepID=UPI002ACA8F64|nr:DUF2510 domain-containing protein [Nocardioides sp. HM23]MDZ5622572.1 DUF2510 domain-containing protein [Nocardioides sp. HM23]